MSVLCQGVLVLGQGRMISTITGIYVCDRTGVVNVGYSKWYSSPSESARIITYHTPSCMCSVFTTIIYY